MVAYSVTMCNYTCLMIQRRFWQHLLDQAWQERSVIWLSGVRRVGKTCLCQSLPHIEYFDCELPRVRRMMEEPEGFFDGLRNQSIVLDEIHRLQNPSELLKIAADHYPRLRVIATGSSTLGASRKFRDTLAGRKRDIWLAPMCLADLKDAERPDLHHRLLRGGLPPFFLADQLPERDFQEWMDAYWAKDIQELFRLESRSSFQKFVELVLAQSGGIFEATRFSRPCEVSRPTIIEGPGGDVCSPRNPPLQHASSNRDRVGPEGLWLRHGIWVLLPWLAGTASRGLGGFVGTFCTE